MPSRFAWWGADLWIPVALDRASAGPASQYFFLLGHLKRGLSPEAARPDIEILARRFAKVYPKDYPKQFEVRLQSLVDNVAGKFKTTLYTLLAAVGFLLLIACGNVANLLLAKATAREKEFAIRTTLGAGRWRVIRQLMVESLMLALAGAVLGCFFAWAGLKGLVALIPRFTFPDEAVIRLNGPVLLATLAAAILTAVIFGLAPALGVSRRGVNEPLKATGRGNSGCRRGRLRNAPIVGEVALSVVLLAGAGLLMRTFFIERQVDLGFRPEHLLTTQIQLPEKQYKAAELQTRFLRDLLPRLQSIPGVVSASGALAFPPFGGFDTEFDVAGKAHTEAWKGQVVLCSPEFFDTLRIRVLKGRLFTRDDVNGQRKVATINQTLASKYFPGEDPIGKRIKLTALATAPVLDPWFQVIGVISDMKNHGIRDSVLPEAYAPFASYGFALFIRAAGNPAALTKAMNDQIWTIDKNIVPQCTRTMEESLDTFIFAKERFGLTLFSIFAAMGLILVSVGIYSVISYTVTQQSHEIGIRVALGATAGNVRGLVIRTGLRFIFIGLGVGPVLAGALTRLMASQIWGVSAFDPITMGSVIVALIIVGMAACYLPSRRATRVDPVISLRYE